MKETITFILYLFNRVYCFVNPIYTPQPKQLNPQFIAGFFISIKCETITFAICIRHSKRSNQRYQINWMYASFPGFTQGDVKKLQHDKKGIRALWRHSFSKIYERSFNECIDL